MKGIIMAGGEGTRLRPLTCTRPKPMVPVLNRPCIDHIIGLLVKHGVTDIGVTLQYLPEEIKTHCGDGQSYGAELHYFVETTPLGTAGSVKNAEEFLDDTFIVISGDALTDCDLSAAYRFHQEHEALVTLVLTSVSCPLEYGVVIRDQQGRVTRFLEKPGWGEVFSDTVNTGIYILEPEVLPEIESGQPVDFSKDLYPRLLAAKKPIYAFVTDSYWCDIGNVEQYLQSHYDLLQGKTGITLPGREIAPGIWVDPTAQLDPAAEVTAPVVIGPGCRIAPGAKLGPETVLGCEVEVGQSASLKRSVVWDHAWIGEGVQLRGTVIGSGARIKSGASLFEASVVGDHSVVGEGAEVKSGVKIWPEKWVEKQTKLKSSLVWGKGARAHCFGARGIEGDLMTEITPDFVCRLGVALGSELKLPARIGIASDGYPGSMLLKYALSSGLLATGVTVVELGETMLPVVRYGVRALELSGGIRISHRGGHAVNLRFINSDGIDYSRSEQRKVEGRLGRDEYRLAAPDRISTLEIQPNLERSYLNHLLQHLNPELTRRGRIRLVADYSPELLGGLLPPLCEALGCDLVTFATLRQEPSFTAMLETAEQFGALVRKQGAGFGAVIDAGGEEMVLVDEEGMIIGEDRLAALLALVILQRNSNATLVFPVTVPSAVEEIARKKGGKVRRSKTAPWALAQNLLQEEVVSSQGGCPQFLLHGDAIAQLGAIIQFLAAQEKPLSQILTELPGYATARSDVEVTWEDKGKVLRHLAEEAGERPVEMVEGIKMFHPEGWALVLPDADEPLCRVYSEGFNQEIAESLTEMYVNKIEEICHKEE